MTRQEFLAKWINRLKMDALFGPRELGGDVDALFAERDRYKKALEEIADTDHQHVFKREPTYSDPCVWGVDCNSDCLPCTARKALSQSTTEELKE